MSRAALAVAVLLALTQIARAETPEVGAAFVVGSETGSAESGGHLGGALTLGLWSGRIGVQMEAGKADWTPDALSWIGIGLRFGLFEYRGCPRQIGAPAPTKDCMGLRPWIAAGVVHESWTFDAHFVREDSEAERNARYLAIGIDLFALQAPASMSTFFRVQRAKLPADMAMLDPINRPYETSLVFGLGVAYGGR